MHQGEHLILRTDGASRGNPGHAASGVVVERTDGTLVARGKQYLGVMTNNQAEYRALIAGLKAADVELDRKVLADLAVVDPEKFAELAEQAKAALAK